MKEFAHLPDLGMFEIHVAFSWTLCRLCWSSFKISIPTALFPGLLIRGCEQEGRSLQRQTVVWFAVTDDQSNKRSEKTCNLVLRSMKGLWARKYQQSTLLRNYKNTFTFFLTQSIMLCIVGVCNLGAISRKPRILFGLVKRFLVHLYLKTEKCIPLNLLLEWRKRLFILRSCE